MNYLIINTLMIFCWQTRSDFLYTHSITYQLQTFPGYNNNELLGYAIYNNELLGYAFSFAVVVGTKILRQMFIIFMSQNHLVWLNRLKILRVTFST